MDTENWLVGWRKIGKYIGKSAKTAQRWAAVRIEDYNLKESIKEGGFIYI